MPVIIIGASLVTASVFGPSNRPFVVGEVHCTGTETELLECSHNSIGDHFCWLFFSNDADDVAIGCGMFLSLHNPCKYTHNSSMFTFLSAECVYLKTIGLFYRPRVSQQYYCC